MEIWTFWALILLLGQTYIFIDLVIHLKRNRFKIGDRVKSRRRIPNEFFDVPPGRTGAVEHVGNGGHLDVALDDGHGVILSSEPKRWKKIK